jgi:two-component system, OmpR family, response regulator
MAMTERQPDGRLVVIEDDESIRGLVAAGLRHAGYHVDIAADGITGLQLTKRARPDLVVLDVNLPGLDGFEVCRRMREAGDEVPVVFLTARREPGDVRSGFLRGGDDYLTKPFSLEELRLRVSAVLRRSGQRGGDDRGRLLRCGHVELDEDAHRVRSHGAEAELTPTEFRLLAYLLRNVDRALSRAQIMEHVWPDDFDGDWQIIESFVSSLRRKLDDGQARVIHTVRGYGYAARDPGPA